MHKLSMHLMEQFVEGYMKIFNNCGIEILDVGSMDVNGCYRELFTKNPRWKYTGMDIQEGKNVDVVVKDPYMWREIADEAYDIVISGQCIEHVEYPWITVQCMAEKLVPGGTLFIIAPSAGAMHRFPLDCYRFFPDGLKALAEYAGLVVIKTENHWDHPGIDNEPNRWKDSTLLAINPYTS